MSRLPTGTVTFLFTDIEGSTRLAPRPGSRATRGARSATPNSSVARLGRPLGHRSQHRRRLVLRGVLLRGRCRRGRGGVQRGLAAYRGPPAGPSACGWACTRERDGWEATTTWASTSTAPRASPPPAMAARCSSPSTTRTLVERVAPGGYSPARSRRAPAQGFRRAGAAVTSSSIDGLADEFPPLRTLEAPTNLPAAADQPRRARREAAEVDWPSSANGGW